MRTHHSLTERLGKYTFTTLSPISHHTSHSLSVSETTRYSCVRLLQWRVDLQRLSTGYQHFQEQLGARVLAPCRAAPRLLSLFAFLISIVARAERARVISVQPVLFYTPRLQPTVPSPARASSKLVHIVFLTLYCIDLHLTNLPLTVSCILL